MSRAITLPPFTTPSQQRTRNMRAIKSRGNRSTECRLRAQLVQSGLTGWTLQRLPEIGSPDFIFGKQRLVVFVDGCFWHGCPRCGHTPKTNSRYWRAKIQRNRKRDVRVRRMARTAGFRVIRIWECDLKQRSQTCLNRIRRALDWRCKQAGPSLA